MEAYDIAKYIVGYGPPRFRLRPNLCAVTNVSWGLLLWEADLIICSKSGYCTEIEIKISFSDWKRDHEKRKFLILKDNYKNKSLIKNFYYAIPKELESRINDINIPEFAGLITIEKFDDGRNPKVVIVKEPTSLNSRKLTESEQLQLCRLGSMRAWKER
jgi:hypothetical protein